MSDEKFSPSEPGISHPLTHCAIGLTDDGRICIMAGDKCGIVLDEETGVVCIYGTEVRFMTGAVNVNGKKLTDISFSNTTGGTPVGRQLRRIDQMKGE